VDGIATSTALDLGARPGTVESTHANTAIVLLSASGRMFNEQVARRLSRLDRVVLICGRYEGVDERVAEHLATEEISIGDFVLSGGELPAAVIVDTVTRLLPGALGNEASAVHESFSTEGAGADAKENMGSASGTAPEWLAAIARDGARNGKGARGGILECPHFTRPAEFRGWPIPEVLIGGNHEEIRLWRRRAALAKTLWNRPELLVHAEISSEELQWLEELHARSHK
jgi:tRNA (guanine37-N1)-methyltransferase